MSLETEIQNDTSTRFQKVGSLDALRSGEPLAATVDGQPVALFVVGDEVVATSGLCPHANGPLHEGEVDGHVLTCPYHGWTFNLQSGLCEDEPTMALQKFQVRVEGDNILVAV